MTNLLKEEVDRGLCKFIYENLETNKDLKPTTKSYFRWEKQ